VTHVRKIAVAAGYVIVDGRIRRGYGFDVVPL